MTSVPPMWKLLTQIFEEVVNNQNLLPEEQTGCRKKACGMHDRLFIDEVVLNKIKKNRRGHLTIACKDYMSARDMIQHSCISELFE